VQKLKLLYFLTSGFVGVVGAEHEVFAYKGSRLTTKKKKRQLWEFSII
jgi:hypothetical protein